MLEACPTCGGIYLPMMIDQDEPTKCETCEDMEFSVPIELVPLTRYFVEHWKEL